MRKLESEEVLPNMNHRKGCKMPVLSLVTLTFDLGLQTRFGARDQTRLPCEFGANLFSGSQDISYTNKKTPQTGRTKKQNIPQLTVCGKKN